MTWCPGPAWLPPRQPAQPGMQTWHSASAMAPQPSGGLSPHTNTVTSPLRHPVQVWGIATQSFPWTGHKPFQSYPFLGVQRNGKNSGFQPANLEMSPSSTLSLFAKGECLHYPKPDSRDSLSYKVDNGHREKTT